MHFFFGGGGGAGSYQVFKSTFRGVMPFLIFLGGGQNILLCFLMDLTSPRHGINNEWCLIIIHLLECSNSACINVTPQGRVWEKG